MLCVTYRPRKPFSPTRQQESHVSVDREARKSTVIQLYKVKVRVKRSLYTPGRPRVFQEFEALWFEDNRHIKVARISALRTSYFYPQETFLVFICVRCCVNPTDIVRPEGFVNEKSQWPTGNRTRDLPVFGAVPQLTPYLLINCTIGKEITYFCATE